jgi:hypothetical protein
MIAARKRLQHFSAGALKMLWPEMNSGNPSMSGRRMSTMFFWAVALSRKEFFFGRFSLFLRLYYLRMHPMSQALCTSYMETMEPEKLLQLRAKTDRQLMDFIYSKLKAGLKFAALAETLCSDGNWASAERSRELGDEALNEVQLLLPVMTERQRRDLEPKVQILREAVRGLRAPRIRTAASMW